MQVIGIITFTALKIPLPVLVHRAPGMLCLQCQWNRYADSVAGGIKRCRGNRIPSWKSAF